MLTVEEFRRLKKEAERLQREADKATGALEEIKKKLKSEFGCKDLKEADALHTKLTKTKKSLEEAYEEAKAKLLKEYPHAVEFLGES